MRPVVDPLTILSNTENWDAAIRDCLLAVFAAPLPLKEYATPAALPAAASYDNCIAAVVAPKGIYYSDGSVWKRMSLDP